MEAAPGLEPGIHSFAGCDRTTPNPLPDSNLQLSSNHAATYMVTPEPTNFDTDTNRQGVNIKALAALLKSDPMAMARLLAELLRRAD